MGEDLVLLNCQQIPDNIMIQHKLSSSHYITMASVSVIIICWLLSPNYTLQSQYDPHVYPASGPFFEGWYTRISDISSGQSYGVLFGEVLRNKNDSSVPTTYIGLIRSDGTNPMVAAEVFPDPAHIHVTVGGQKVSKDPKLKGTPDFQWSAKNYGFFRVTEKNTNFDFTVDGIHFTGSFGAPVLWDYTGRGPEGLLTSIPLLPLHWFVHSTGSRGSYSWSEDGPGHIVKQFSGDALAHQEKNWGRSFPPAWVWTQGNSNNSVSSFAGAFGELELLPGVQVPSHLFGYRNHDKRLSMDFHPSDSVAKTNLSPCEGTASIKILSLTHQVELSMKAPLSSFGTCLRGPVEQGFVKNVVETFVADINIKIFKKKGLSKMKLIEDETFHGAAFEFGRQYLCMNNNPCLE